MGDCCLNIYGVGVVEEEIVYEVNSVLLGEYPNYSFDIGEGYLLYVVYNETTSMWDLIDDGDVLASSEFFGDEACPDGLQFVFNSGDRSPDYTYTVYKVPCDLTPTPPTIEYPVECLQEACRNKNLFNKHKRMLAEDIAGISKKEIFGFKCGDAWENIFMRNMIIHALSCMPTGVLSVEKENCLIGKLTDKCNC
jgi:hypothetical protein